MFLSELLKHNLLTNVAQSTNAAIYTHDTIGKVASVNNEYMLAINNKSESEILAMIAFFTETFMSTKTKNILLFNSMNLDLANTFITLGAKVGLVQSDNESLDFLKKNFFDTEDIYDNPNFSKVANIIDLDFLKYDIIIAQQTLNHHQLDGLSRLLEHDGILIYKPKSPLLHMDNFAKSIKEAGDFFDIVMPFRVPDSLKSQEYYVFASKKYHPLSDMNLQKIDMLRLNKFYNAKIHIAAFAITQSLKSQLKNIAKN